MEQTHSGRNTVHPQSGEHLDSIGHPAAVVLIRLDKEGRCLAAVCIFERRALPHLRLAGPWVGLYCRKIVIITDIGGQTPVSYTHLDVYKRQDMQREESIDAQVRACTYYARQYQYEIVHVYADRAQSGKRTKNREQFLQMINDASDGGFEVILVHKLNRFGRNTCLLYTSRCV